MGALSTSSLLMAVATIMVVWAFKDLIVARRVTPAARVRLLVAAIFLAVLAWNHLKPAA